MATKYLIEHCSIKELPWPLSKMDPTMRNRLHAQVFGLCTLWYSWHFVYCYIYVQWRFCLSVTATKQWIRLWEHFDLKSSNPHDQGEAEVLPIWLKFNLQDLVFLENKVHLVKNAEMNGRLTEWERTCQLIKKYRPWRWWLCIECMKMHGWPTPDQDALGIKEK